MQTIQEQSAKIKAELPKQDPHKKLPVFYNPVMKFNRDLSIILLNSLPYKNINLALPLAGSGIRGLRFLQELKKNKIKKLFINDLKPNFKKIFLENLKLNRLENKKNLISLHNEDANLFILHQQGFDYLDLDPFGSPNFLLNNSIVRLSRNGILAVTATDTAALTGTYLNTCKRKYWSFPLRNELMHEIGLRILIRKTQLIAAQFEKALQPIFSYSKDHYYRIFFQNKKSKSECDKIIKQHQYFHYCNKCLNRKTSPHNHEICQCKNKFLTAGPLWIGNLFNKDLLKKIQKQNYSKIIDHKENIKFLETIFQESEKNILGFYDLHKIAKIYKLKLPKIEAIVSKLKATRTFFSPTGIKTEKKIKEIIKNYL